MTVEKLGEGGEAEVFAIDDRRVLRRFRRPDHPAVAERIELTAQIAAGASDLAFAVPEILDHHVDADGRPCLVERRLPGRAMSDALADVDGRQRRQLLESYLTTAWSLRRIEFDRPWFGELLAPDPIRTGTWHEYLTRVLDRQVAATDVGAFPELADLVGAAPEVLIQVTAAPEPPPSLVHFDYCPMNVMCDDWRVTAVIDWSVLTIVGDADLDPSLAVAYLGVTPNVVDDDASFGWSWLAERGIADVAARYERWAAAWWLPGSADPKIRAWVTGVLAQPFGPEP